MATATQDLYSPDVDLDSFNVDELVQRLETMEKNNEQIKRENQLFESHLLRKSKENMPSDEETAKKWRELKQKGGDKALILTPEMKYEIASQELETLKANIEEGRDKSETLLERLKAILEGTDLSIAEIRKEAFDFGRFLSAAENGRIGKYDAEKLSKYMFDKLKQKEAYIDKLQSKNVSYKVQILKAEQQIKHKEDMGEDLKFIDFHQLQIENKKHVKDISDRNNKLIQLKMNSGKTVITMNKLKKELTLAERESERIDKQAEAHRANLEKKKLDIKSTQKKIEKEVKVKAQLYAMSTQNSDMPNPKAFVEQKNLVVELRKSKKNWERKIEIAELEARKARAILRKRDRQAMMQGYDFNQ